MEINVAGGYDVKEGADVMEAGLKSRGLSEYERTKAENITKLRLQLANLDKQFSAPEEVKQKAGPKKSPNHGKRKGEAVIRQESPRNKSK